MNTLQRPVLPARIFPAPLRAIVVGILLVLWATFLVLLNNNAVRPLLAASGVGSAETLGALTKLKTPLIFLSVVTLGFATLLRRRQPFGGWLLFFYLSLVANALTTAFQFPDIIERFLHPSAWNTTKLYTWGLADTAADVLVLVAELSAATLLLIRKQRRYIRVLCTALVASIVCRVILQVGLTLVSGDAPDGILQTTRSIFTLIVSAAWYLYFLNSVRVRLLYLEHAWTYELQRQLVGRLKLRDPLYNLGRAAIVAAVIFAISSAIFATMPPFSGGKIQDVLPPTLFMSTLPAIMSACISCFAPTRIRIRFG